MSIKPTQLVRLQRLIDTEHPEKFYSWKSWERVRQKVLKMDNFECQNCKRKGRYSKGYIVHHIKHLRDRPDLAMSIFDPDTGDRQLETVCKECHEEEHPESLKQYQYKPKNEPITAERWD